jgi:23S rRNA (guanosine2251-2'-O)-methyltransferase
VGADEELVAGRRPVEEAFVARREAHRLLVVPQRREALEALVLHATALRIPVVEVEGGTLTSLAGFDGHQGVALVVLPRRWASLDDVLSLALQRGEPPLVLVLDSLEDPQNVGTLLRSAEACGVHGVIFPTRNAAPITPAAVKASAGATEHLLLVPVDDLPGTLVDLRTRGLHLVGTDAEAPLGYRDADLRGPLALVVGSEGHGLGGPVRRRLELVVRIPMRGRVGSLNAAVAGSVLLFEAASQRPPGSSPGGDAPGAFGAPAAVGASGLDDTARPEQRPSSTPSPAPELAAAEPVARPAAAARRRRAATVAAVALPSEGAVLPVAEEAPVTRTRRKRAAPAEAPVTEPATRGRGRIRPAAAAQARAAPADASVPDSTDVDPVPPAAATDDLLPE